MQNWNQWQLPAGAVTTPIPQPPVGYAALGADPMAMMQTYMQYYNQPAPSGYTAEQWAAAQQQCWAQWQQWQQQYQQWQAQYGEKYQETMKQLGLLNQATLLPNVQPPPLPKEDVKPPLPPNTLGTYQFTSIPPPHQNNLPLFPAKQSTNNVTQTSASNSTLNPPLPSSQPPLPPDSSVDNENTVSSGKRASNTVSESNSVKKMKLEDEELTEAEKTFDAQFKQWEEQFNKWKEQNANHPDKTQYKQYEAKWTTWREKLIERREQMRKKREQQKQSTPNTESEKGKSLPGDDKILNILSNTENQGLINNLLGIGKSLGLTGKQTGSIPPPPPPPPPATQSNNTGDQLISSSSVQSSVSQSQPSGVSSNHPNLNSALWNTPWTQQSNTGGNQSLPHGFQTGASGGPSVSNIRPSTQLPPPNFAQPPPNFPLPPNFSQPPPNFPHDSRLSQRHNRPPGPDNTQGSTPFGPNDGMSLGMNSGNERTGPGGNHFENMNTVHNFETNRSREGPQDNFNRDSNNKKFPDPQSGQYRSDPFGFRTENSNLERGTQMDQFRRDDRSNQDFGNNMFNRQKPGSSFNPGNDRFGPGSDRFGSANDYPNSGDRFGPGNDRFSGGNNRFGPGGDQLRNDRFGNDSFGPNDRFGPGNDRLDSNNERFNPSNDPYRPGVDRRDNFPGNQRNFNRGNQFEPSDKLTPELKKLMEKRKAAMDVFKPSFLDPEKNSTVGSLSESFKKITGDLSFSKYGSECPKDYDTTKGNNTNFGPRGGNFGGVNFGGGNFGSPGNFRFPVTEFRSLGQDQQVGHFSPGLGFPTRNLLEHRELSGPFRGSGDFGPRGEKDFDGRVPCTDLPPSHSADVGPVVGAEVNFDKETAKNDLGMTNAFRTKDLESFSEKKYESNNTIQEMDISKSPINEESEGNIDYNNSEKNKIPLLDDPGSKINVDGEKNGKIFEKSVSVESKYTKREEAEAGEGREKEEQEDQEEGEEEGRDVSYRNNNISENIMKKSEVLPFMGENDPKPEDLNMEPPPELPNLGPLTTDSVNQSKSETNRGKDSSDPKPLMRSFTGPSEFCGSKEGFNGPQGSRFQGRQNAPTPFGPKGPETRFPGFEPRIGPPFNSGPNSGLRGLNNDQIGPLGPQGSDTSFGPTSHRFGPNKSFDSIDNRGSDQKDQFPNPRRPNDGFPSPWGPNDGPFASRGSKDGPFGLRGVGDRQFDNQGPKDGPFGLSRFSDRSFDGQGSSFGQNLRNRDGKSSLQGNVTDIDERGPDDFRGRSHRDEFPKDSPFSGMKSETGRVNDIDERFPERNVERGNLDPRADPGCDLVRSVFDNRERMRDLDSLNTRALGLADARRPMWRQSFSKDNLTDVDQRFGRDSNRDHNRDSSMKEQRSFVVNRGNPLDKNWQDKDLHDPARNLNVGEFKGSYRLSQVSRCPVKEFCIEKQFNYNHGGTAVDKKFNEYIPAKVIDYAHTTRNSSQDNLTPVQCFDYGHGNLKPVIPEHEVYPKKDFRNWNDSEQNLKDYVERGRRYDHYGGGREVRRQMDYSQRRDIDRNLEERRYESERRERESYRDKERSDEGIYERTIIKDQDMRYHSDRSSNKERLQERSETSHKETSRDDKDIDRSKGSLNWQDTSSKNIVEAKPQSISVPEPKQNVLDTPPKTLELAKTPNSTMVDDLLCPPGRQNRPPKIAIILRGPPGSGKSFVAKLIKDKEVEQGGSAPRILSLDDYFLVEKEIESKDDNGKKVVVKEMVYEYEEAMEQSYTASLVKAFKKNITDGFFNFIILDCINEKISDYEELWSFAKTKGFKVYVCEMEMDLQICMKRNIHNRTEDEINRIIDYFEPTPSYHQKLDVNSMLQDQAIEEVQMEDTEETPEEPPQANEDSQDSQEDSTDAIGVSKWERMEAEDKLDRLDGLAKKKHEGNVQTMQDFLQVPDYYNMEDTSGKKRVRWADLEERKEQEKMRAVGFVVGHTNWDRMMDPTKGGSALTRTKFFTLS